MQYFTADTHFFHKQLLGQNDFAPRPFESVAAMNRAIIRAWNERVLPHDVVYHLGDIAMCPGNYPSQAEILGVLSQLNGHLVFIKGNHDSRALFKYLAKHDPLAGKQHPKFQFHDVGALIKMNHFHFFMTHYPLLLGITSQTMNLHGHIHHSSVPIAENINVGIDAPERELLAHKLPFGTPLAEAELFEIYHKKQALLAKKSTQK